MAVTIPLKTLYEAEGLIITVETQSGSSIRGTLKELDDYMNMLICDATVVDKCGEATKAEKIYIRGSIIRFVILPPAIKFAPFLLENKNQKITLEEPIFPKK